MTSAQDFEVVLRSKGNTDEGTVKDVLAIVKQVVENSACDMAISNMKNKLNKKYGGRCTLLLPCVEGLCTA